MNIVELSGLITSVGALLAAITSVVNIYISMRNGRRIREVHDLANGMKTDLVNEVRAASFAQGVKSEADKK